jgi:hypothetical protein
VLLNSPPRTSDSTMTSVRSRRTSASSTRSGNEVASRDFRALYVSRQHRSAAALLLDRATRHTDPQACIAALESVAHIYADEMDDARALRLVRGIRREPDRPHVLEHLYRLAPAANSWTIR